MTAFAIFNLTLLALIPLYALVLGGGSERFAAAALVIGTCFTILASSAPAQRFAGVETGILIVDLATLAAFLALALRSDRFWPIWIAALQLIGTLVHVARLADPDMLRATYAFLLSVWTYPMLLLIGLGTWSHRRRLARENLRSLRNRAASADLMRLGASRPRSAPERRPER